MTSPLRTSHAEGTQAPMPELAISLRRRPVPTRSRLRTLRVPVVMYVVALLLIPALMVAGFMSTGVWATTGTSAAARAGTGSGDGGTGPAAPAHPADVKGSMTLQQVVDAFPPMTATMLLAQFGAPLDTPTSTQLKSLVESGNGMDIPALRTWLQEQASG